MDNRYDSFVVRKIKEETADMRLISVDGERIWQFVPGQVAVLSKEEGSESYFAIASAPEDREGMDFLVRNGKGTNGALFSARTGEQISGKGPVGKGFPIDNYQGRDLFLAAVGSAIAPIRGVIRSVNHRRAAFGKIVLVYGARHVEDIPLLDEMEGWRSDDMDIILTVSRPEGSSWSGKTGYVQAHFEQAIAGLQRPVALICGMNTMMEQSKESLGKLGIAPEEILTNY